MFFSSRARTWRFRFYKELLPCGERSESFSLWDLGVFLEGRVLFFHFPGPLETGVHHTMVVPGRCSVEHSYNRAGLPGKMVSISSYSADPVLTLLEEVAASLAFAAAAVSDFQPTITNCVIILQHCLGLRELKTVVCSSSLSGTTSVDGLCCWNCRGQRWSRFVEAYLFCGHLGTTPWTLLLALNSFNELCQPCFLTMMEELNQTGKGCLRKPCRP